MGKKKQKKKRENYGSGYVKCNTRRITIAKNPTKIRTNIIQIAQAWWKQEFMYKMIFSWN